MACAGQGDLDLGRTGQLAPSSPRSAHDEYASRSGQRARARQPVPRLRRVPEMVVLPPGEFMMGSSRKEEGHSMTKRHATE